MTAAGKLLYDALAGYPRAWLPTVPRSAMNAQAGDWAAGEVGQAMLACARALHPFWERAVTELGTRRGTDPAKLATLQDLVAVAFDRQTQWLQEGPPKAKARRAELDRAVSFLRTDQPQGHLPDLRHPGVYLEALAVLRPTLAMAAGGSPALPASLSSQVYDLARVQTLAGWDWREIVQAAPALPDEIALPWDRWHLRWARLARAQQRDEVRLASDLAGRLAAVNATAAALWENLSTPEGRRSLPAWLPPETFWEPRS